MRLAFFQTDQFTAVDAAGRHHVVVETTRRVSDADVDGRPVWRDVAKTYRLSTGQPVCLEGADVVVSKTSERLRRL